MLRLKIWFLIWFFKHRYGYSKVPVSVIFAQAIHETGKFTSKVFKENKNLFGMRLPQVRETLAIGSKHNHAVYKNLLDSVRDYFLRQKNFRIVDLAGPGYVRATVWSGYAEDPDYREKWEAWIDKVKGPLLDKPFYVAFFLQ